ncbi:MAG: tRNA (N(6)-L-threonylcarbamoyladenosine(37)-C(2))-methylthiotransferase MtaB [Alphaproteobacteria bacterium]
MTEARVITFGCRLNAYESEVIRRHLRATGPEDAVVVNTCAVTAEAERQARQAIRRARRESPEARIIVTGCAAQIDPETYAAMPEVDQVLGNQEKLAFESFARPPAERVIVNDIMGVKETASHLLSGFEGKSRAFVQVQNGCDHRCTFCVIPLGRGPSRSVPMGDVVSEVRALAANGYREVVLTGVDITAYGEDLPGQPGLGRLVRRLLAAVPELGRLRLTSLDSAEVDGELVRLFAEEVRLAPHLHLSLQAGDDLVLKRMKRRHSRGRAIAFCRAVRALRPDTVFGADLIAGFPTETEEMFQRTLDLVDEAGLTYLHVFPYSPRPRTPAARMPQVPAPVRKERAARLRAKGAAALAAFLQSRVGTEAEVLVEREGFGRTEHFAPLRLESHGEPGRLVPVEVTGTDATALYGRPL